MKRRWMKSSRNPPEKCGSALSDDFGSLKTLGSFVPLSTAGQPVSVSHTGFDCGTHAVGAAASMPPGRS